jgi:hypothetical protein
MARQRRHDNMNVRGRRIFALAALVSFWTWCALLSYPLIGETVDLAHDVVVTVTPNPMILICQAVGLVLFLTIMSLGYFARIGTIIGSLNFAQVAIFLIISMSFFLQLHGNELAILVGIFYTALLLATVLMVSALWTLAPADLERCMSVASVILCLFGISAIAILGLPQDRNIGHIQPNLFAAPLLVGFIFSQFRAGLIGIVVRILCFGMVALVSSRFALIGCVAAIVVHELTFKPLTPGKLPVLILTLAAVYIFWPQIASVLALDDPLRGTSSGFTGRDTLWRLWLDAMTEHPFGVGFKRSLIDEAGHNGYFKTLLEFGVVGGGLMIVFLGCNLVMAGIDAARSSGMTRQQRRFACARFGGLVALSFGAFFQPQLLSLGEASSMSMLFLLFKPKVNSTSDRAHLVQHTL